MSASATHLVLIPSYNTGPRLAATVEEALAQWSPVWVVVDGSTDGSDKAVRARAADDGRLRVILQAGNGGKGAAVATGVEAALAAGFTHVLTMDADGQHPAAHIGAFMRASIERPEAMILGRPVFGPEVPKVRLHGRKLSVAMARAQILGPGIDDPLFGFRVYPAAALHRALRSTRHGRRYDFDHEMAVRLFWSGVPAVNLPAPCRYLSPGEGGISHFHYVRDNLTLVWLNVRLLLALAGGRWRGIRRARRVLLALLMLGAAGARAADPSPIPETAIADPLHDPAWAGLFAKLAPDQNREAPFEERRYFPFRRGPVVLTGELRIAKGRGLSLAYSTPEPRILIVDDRGVLVRGSGGESPAPESPQTRAYATVLTDLIRFDLPHLVRTFTLRGGRRGADWALELTPRDRELARQFRTIAVSGTLAQPARIEFERSASERIEILIGPAREGADFAPGELARYFR